MSKGFWDWMISTGISYTEIDEEPKKRKQNIKLIRNNKQMIIDVDDYKILDEAEEMKLIR